MNVSNFVYLTEDSGRIHAKVTVEDGGRRCVLHVEKNSGSIHWYFSENMSLAPGQVEELYNEYVRRTGEK